jgi:hypothetical protein
MQQVLTDRHLVIFVRDRAGHLLRGADISFAIDGQPYGQVEGSEGRGEITLPGTNARPVDVTVSYNGEIKTARVAFGQQSYEFRYDTDVSHEGGHLALWVGCGLVAVSVVLAFAFKEPNTLQTKIIQGLFALGLGGFATELSGFLKVDMKWGTRLVIGAGGALAVFIVLWFTNAKL